MEVAYYDRDGHPVSREHWQQLSRRHEYCRVGHTDIVRHGWRLTVVTYWLGAVAGQPEPPPLFHTYAELAPVLRGGPVYWRLWGWPTLSAADTGHQAVTGWLGEVAAWLAGAAAGSRPPPPGGPPPPGNRGAPPLPGAPTPRGAGSVPPPGGTEVAAPGRNGE